jgi:hypothetical protein
MNWQFCPSLINLMRGKKSNKEMSIFYELERKAIWLALTLNPHQLQRTITNKMRINFKENTLHATY